ncbi:hypothetical protein [Bacteroides sp. 519]|uniref:hypothetical protein n=1 Tax=Bacteroides sp. 519 TaxID=2302937 RepID=UPI0013CF8CA0|nr:hypothetical protein [Bacteroides sp. 519]NDV59192.1 hypothetical protein [Bacteroides sp. 519]
MKIYQYILLTLTWASIMFAACERDMGMSEIVDPKDEGKVTIEIFTRAQNLQLPQTRGFGAKGDSIEKTPYVLVFRGNDGDAVCVEAVKAIEYSGTVKRYVQLTQQPAGTDYRFLILANNGEYSYWEGTRFKWSEFALTNFKDKSLSYISDNLLTDKLGNPQITPPYVSEDWKYILPMSYLTGPVNGINETTKIGTTDNPIALIRGVAQIVFYNVPELYV